MTRGSPESLVRRFYAALNRRDLNAAFAMWDPKAVAYTPSSPEPKGKETFLSIGERFSKAFPDMKYKILGIMAKGGVVAIEGIATATFKGPLETPAGTVPPTGGHIEFGYADFYRVNSRGMIAEYHTYYDTAGFNRQLRPPSRS